MGASPQDGSEGLVTSSLYLRDFARRTIDVKVVDENHLTAPLHMRMGHLLLPLRLPRAPRGGLFLGDADQDHLALTAFFSRGSQQWLSNLLLVVAFGEVANRNAFSLSPAVDGGHVGFTDLPEGSRRRDLEPAAIEELADLADRLELGHVRLQKQAINRTTGQRNVVAKQGGIIG